MGAETGTDELRLNWSARGLAYLLSKHGIERPLPITSPGDGTARVELRIIGAEVEVWWVGARGFARHARVLGKDSLGHSRGRMATLHRRQQWRGCLPGTKRRHRATSSEDERERHEPITEETSMRPEDVVYGGRQ